MSKNNLKSMARALLLSSAMLAAPMAAYAAGTLTVASNLDPGSLDPIDTFLVPWSTLGTNLFDGLLYRTPELKLVPALATEWKVSEDGKQIKFVLRQGVKFHNGEPFNAAAVKFTFDRLLGDVGAKGPQRANYTAIDKIEIIDDYNIVMHLKQPDPVLLTKLAGYGGMIVPPKYIQEQGEDNFNTKPVGTGPFKLVSYTPKVNVVMEAFKEYYGGAPKLDKIDFKFISEAATAVAELQAGRVDIVNNVPVSMVKTVEGSSNLQVLSLPSPTVQALRFNTKNGITKDLKVREAIIHAVDRDAIIKTILAGQAAPVATLQSKLSFGNDPDLKPRTFDINKAKALLKEAGVPAGAPVQIDIRANDPTFAEVAQAVASYLRVAGLNPSIKPYETSILLDDIIPNGKTGEMFSQGWGGWTFDYDNTAYLLYHSGQKWNPYDKDKKLDDLLESQRLISDTAKREKVLQEAARYTFDNAIDMPIYNLNAIIGINKRVKNYSGVTDNRTKFDQVTVD